MSKDSKPAYASEVPYVPVNWEDRDTITRRVCDILEAVMPEGNQLEKTKDLVKEMTKQYWITLFNDQFDNLQNRGLIGSSRNKYSEAIWNVALGELPKDVETTNAELRGQIK